MRVLIGCEYSGVVRRAFRAAGHNAWSIDLLPSEDNSEFHIQGDIDPYLTDEWDLLIAHPPCTRLTVSGARWFKDYEQEQAEALDFVRRLMDAPIERIAIENPIGVISSRIRKPDQIVQPWWFGHPTTKATCLWLKNLPLLTSTDPVEPEWHYYQDGSRTSKWHYDTSLMPHDQRGHIRSRTFEGMAEAMAQQWG